jgi:type IV pilus assembly protein PilB
MAVETYAVKCWNCLGEFDALNAVWCSHDPKNPTKLCPFCFRCFCDASEKYKQEFWKHAPPRLQDELVTLNKSKDRLGDVLIRLKKITTPQLLEALVEQKESGQRLGEILVRRGVVRPDDVESAVRSQGTSPLVDTLGVAYAGSPTWDQSGPDAIIDYLLNLGARRGASDLHIEPKDDAISVKFRIDGFYFRVDPIPNSYLNGLSSKLIQLFRLDPARLNRPQRSKVTSRLNDTDYDLIVQTLPTTAGVSATIKLVNRSSFVKDLTTIGLEIEDRVRLMEELRNTLGLVLLTGPVFGGVHTSAYSIMNFLVRGQRDIVSLESPLQWTVEGVRQVEIDSQGLSMAETLRSVVAVRPEVVVLTAVPDAPTALLATQLASSVLVIAVVHSQTAGQGVTSFLQMGVPPQLLSSAVAAVTCQRLVRQICRICREPADPPSAQTLGAHGITAEEALTLEFFRGKGCPTCNKVGYRGRRAIFEVLNGSPEVRSAILRGASAGQIEKAGLATGATSLRKRCLELVRQGVTTFDEFNRLRL